MKTTVYIDGFNLYYRALKDTPYKWLDLYKLAQELTPKHTINRIRYFTANVLSTPNNPGAPVRQQIYIRALRTIPNLSIHLGQFKLRQKTGRLVTSKVGLPSHSTIEIFEEKGTDVNLATFLLTDAYEQDYEQAVVISK